MHMPDVIIDCDPGHDDALAILLAARHAKILGITTVSGNAPLEAVTRNALAIVELLGEQIPVHSGASAPFEGAPRHAEHVHGDGGLGGSQLPPPRGRVTGDDAVGYLLETTRHSADVWIIAIGPLTNVAQALLRDPGLAQRVAGISIMGGSTTSGNVTAAAEFNIWADPEAAQVVLGSGAKLRLCGLNLTHQVRSAAADVVRLRRAAGSRAAFAADLLEFLHERMLQLTGDHRAALHDPCAVLAVTAPELLRFESRSVVVELDGAHTRGMTLVDERQRSAAVASSANVEVAYGIDAPRAKALIMDAPVMDTPGGEGLAAVRG